MSDRALTYLVVKDRIEVRALYRAKYLLLDEATNQLDSKTKFEILENIKSKYKNMTTIIVSHVRILKNTVVM